MIRWARFVVRNRMYTPAYWVLGLRYLWLRIRRPHIVTRGFVFLERGADVYCRRGLGHLEIGRFVRVGRGTAIRCHEGYLRVGDKVVFGARDTVNCYLDVDIDDEALFADDVYVGDFDHRTEDAGVPIRRQGIVASPIRIGRGAWLGVKSTVLRGTRLGDRSVLGAHAVARGRFPEGSVVVGIPGRVVRRLSG